MSGPFKRNSIHDINVAVCQFLGLDPEKVIGLEVTLDRKQAPTARVDMFITEVGHMITTQHQGAGLSVALMAVAEERRHQVQDLGFDAQHDDEHGIGELAKAASCYALHDHTVGFKLEPPNYWPWENDAWKPKAMRENLVRAAALLVAAIEHHDRHALSEEPLA